MKPIILLTALFIAMQTCADVAITDLTYDKVNDDLIVTVEFPGKCLSHEFGLVPAKGKGKNYFRLTMTNSMNDPCNALTTKVERFSMKEITSRPAEILVSAHVDGSRPHAITLSAHPAVNIIKLRKEKNSLALTLSFAGQNDPDRFYIDVQSGKSGLNEGVIRDRRAHAYAHEPMRTKEIIFTPKDLPRQRTLIFYRGDDRQAVRVNLP